MKSLVGLDLMRSGLQEDLVCNLKSQLHVSGQVIPQGIDDYSDSGGCGLIDFGVSGFGVLK